MPPKGSDVDLTVFSCLYQCCGGGWTRRDYEATYRGRVMTVNESTVLLFQTGLGRITQVLAEAGEILTWREVWRTY